MIGIRVQVISCKKISKGEKTNGWVNEKPGIKR
jgi:hypothetical protein